KGKANSAASTGCSTFFIATVYATLAESWSGCADNTRPVRNRAVPEAPCPTRVKVLLTKSGGVRPESAHTRPSTGARTIGWSSAFLRTVGTLERCTPEDSISKSDKGVTTIAATATATATEIDADSENNIATIGNPAEPTFGPDAVSAIRALSLRSL